MRIHAGRGSGVLAPDVACQRDQRTSPPTPPPWHEWTWLPAWLSLAPLQEVEGDKSSLLQPPAATAAARGLSRRSFHHACSCRPTLRFNGSDCHSVHRRGQHAALSAPDDLLAAAPIQPWPLTGTVVGSFTVGLTHPGLAAASTTTSPSTTSPSPSFPSASSPSTTSPKGRRMGSPHMPPPSPCKWYARSCAPTESWRAGRSFCCWLPPPPQQAAAAGARCISHVASRYRWTCFAVSSGWLTCWAGCGTSCGDPAAGSWPPRTWHSCAPPWMGTTLSG